MAAGGSDPGPLVKRPNRGKDEGVEIRPGGVANNLGQVVDPPGHAPTSAQGPQVGHLALTRPYPRKQKTGNKEGVYQKLEDYC